MCIICLYFAKKKLFLGFFSKNYMTSKRLSHKTAIKSAASGFATGFLCIYWNGIILFQMALFGMEMANSARLASCYYFWKYCHKNARKSITSKMHPLKSALFENKCPLPKFCPSRLKPLPAPLEMALSLDFDGFSLVETERARETS